MLVVYLGGNYRKQEWEKEGFETSKKESGEKECVSTFAVIGNMGWTALQSLRSVLPPSIVLLKSKSGGH